MTKIILEELIEDIKIFLCSKIIRPRFGGDSDEMFRGNEELRQREAQSWAIGAYESIHKKRQ